MSSKPTVVIFGATGNQGGSVLRTLASSDDYHVRAVTRSKSSRSSQQLATEFPSVEWVEANLDKPSTLPGAIAGAQIVFGVTQFFQPAILGAVDTNKDAEFEQGKRLIDASIQEGVEFIVFSTLPSTTKISNGKITSVLHFEGKYKIQEYLLSQPVKSACIQLCAYYQNQLQGPRWDEDGETVILGLPVDSNIKVPQVDVERDTGPFVKYVIDNREEMQGKVLPVASGYYSQNEIAEAFTAATGIKAKAYHFFSKYNMFEGLPDYVEINKRVPHEFVTPEAFWRATGFRGPAKE
ncbi:NAD(P)-binding protein [Martensiomyces pterosporus]|nr:NAD(P)-binding protein [Martensiomyces pterosporus]